MINTDFKSIIDLIKAFPDEQNCIDHLEKLRWNGNVVSPFDPTSKVYNCKNNRYKCKNTGKYFNVKTATLFDNTKIELQKWFMAIYLVTGHSKGISSIQLSKDLNVTQKTAWFMAHRIRNCFGISDNQLEGEVEVDETYIGGSINKMNHERKKKVQKIYHSQGMEHKKPVLGMVQRGGDVKAMTLQKAQGIEMRPILFKEINESSTVITDGFGGYQYIDRVFKKHVKIQHSQGVYGIGAYNTNTIEGFWSILKRGIIGIYHFVSVKHLDNYLNEFTFRYNNRNESIQVKFNELLSNTEHRLKYSELIKAGA